MSHSKKAFLVIDDDEDDGIIYGSPSSDTKSLKLSSSQKSFSSGGQSLKTKSSQSKTVNRSFSSSKQKKWISSSFDGFGSSFSSTDEVPVKKKRKSKQSELLSKPIPATEALPNEIISSEGLWIDKYKPESESELAIHKKKIEEVRSWLLENLCKKSNGILLLTGPVGAGKTATLHALSIELSFEVQEWINPTISSAIEGPSFDSQQFNSKYISSQSQMSQFQEFLLRANKYPTLSIFGSNTETQIIQKKIILIEDMPNIFFQDAKKFHEVLLTYKHKGRSPLILVISDSHDDSSNVHRLLPKAMHLNLGVTTISFNPVAHTSLIKALNRIAILESRKVGKDFLLPSKEMINELAESCAGDIRTAINALQFCCQKGIQDNPILLYKSTMTPSTSRGKRSKRPATQGTQAHKTKAQGSQARKTAGGLSYSTDKHLDNNQTMTAIGGKDTTLFLFKALGKILYCKRDSSVSDKDLLPMNMSHLARTKPLFCPEDVVERAHLSSEMLTLYLHQNYLDFFTDIEDVVLASEYLSDANMMSVEWMHRSSLIPYMSCIATRGLLFSNAHRVGSSASVGATKGGWRPLHKPHWFEANKKTRSNSQTAKDLFPDQTCPTAVLHTQVLPYLAITDVPLRTPGQITFVQQMGRYQKNKSAFRSHTDTLDEKDCGGDSEDDEPTDSQGKSSSKRKQENQSSSTKITDSQEPPTDEVEMKNSDEDVVIEDFDDEW